MTDKEIIRTILGGNIHNYSLLVEKYQLRLGNHIFFMVHDIDVTDDICQETFIKAYTALDRYNATFQFSTWLYRIATNTALDFLRRKRAVSLEDIPEIADPREYEEYTDIEQREASVRSAIRQLPLKYQTIIDLYYWAEKDYSEIAYILDIPIGTVGTWLARAKLELKENLNG